MNPKMNDKECEICGLEFNTEGGTRPVYPNCISSVDGRHKLKRITPSPANEPIFKWKECGWKFQAKFPADKEWKVSNLEAGGLTSEIDSNEEQIHYIRQDTRDIVNILDNLSPKAASLREKEVYRAMWIYGPPGSGKSTTVYGWAQSKSDEVKVLWVHFEKSIRLVRTFKGKCETTNIGMTMWESVLSLADDYDIVILDGGGDPISDLYYQLYTEKKKDLILIACTSFQAHSYKSEYQAKMVYSGTFCVNSWTLDEYKGAQACGVLKYTDEELMEHYFYAGGSIRFMFFSLQKARQDIKAAFTRVANFKLVLEGLQGEGATQTVNTIVAVFYNGDHTTALSQFVVRLLSAKVDDNFIRAAKMVLPNNPSWQGWVLELEFMILLRDARGVTLFNDTQKQTWPSSAMMNVFDHKDLKEKFEPGQSCWIIPEKFNQGCFDALYYHNKGKIDIFNVTLAKDVKNYNLEYVKEFLFVLAGEEMEGACDITFYIVNPPKHHRDITKHRFQGSEFVANFDDSWKCLKYWDGLKIPEGEMLPIDKRIILQLPSLQWIGQERSEPGIHSMDMEIE